MSVWHRDLSILVMCGDQSPLCLTPSLLPSSTLPLFFSSSQVRARGTYESVSEGDYGVYRQTNNGHPPAQFAWDGLGGDTYWLWWHQVEILPPLNDGADEDEGYIHVTIANS